MKVAVFGKPGGGKSTLSQRIAAVVQAPLHQLDLVQFAEGGVRIADAEFRERHARILATGEWVVDGFGNAQLFRDLLQAADTLVYVERPSHVHYWWVTKRLLLSPVRWPLGWPKGSPLVQSTLSSYRILRISHTFWTDAFRDEILALRPAKHVYLVRRQSDADAMLRDLRVRAARRGVR
jgi:adenylate kinase family enzyme